MFSELSNETKTQIHECLELVRNIFDTDLLGVYLYGSAVLGGLQKFSDIDLLVVSNRPTSSDEKIKLAKNLLQISGVYMKTAKLPVEMTIVTKSAINPWHYPPHFDFQYGDWLRQEFSAGNFEPWPNTEMSELAIMLTQLLLAHHILFGPPPDQLINEIPYSDFIAALTTSANNLMREIHSDTRNVLLTYARIWNTVFTNSIRSKSSAAVWAIDRLPNLYKPVLQRALAICTGKENEHWEDIFDLIQPCAEFMKKIIELIVQQS